MRTTQAHRHSIMHSSSERRLMDIVKRSAIAGKEREEAMALVEHIVRGFSSKDMEFKRGSIQDLEEMLASRGTEKLSSREKLFIGGFFQHAIGAHKRSGELFEECVRQDHGDVLAARLAQQSYFRGFLLPSSLSVTTRYIQFFDRKEDFKPLQIPYLYTYARGATENGLLGDAQLVLDSMGSLDDMIERDSLECYLRNGLLKGGSKEVLDHYDMYKDDYEVNFHPADAIHIKVLVALTSLQTTNYRAAKETLLSLDELVDKVIANARGEDGVCHEMITDVVCLLWKSYLYCKYVDIGADIDTNVDRNISCSLGEDFVNEHRERAKRLLPYIHTGLDGYGRLQYNLVKCLIEENSWTDWHMASPDDAGRESYFDWSLSTILSSTNKDKDNKNMNYGKVDINGKDEMSQLHQDVDAMNSIPFSEPELLSKLKYDHDSQSMNMDVNMETHVNMGALDANDYPELTQISGKPPEFAMPSYYDYILPRSTPETYLDPGSCFHWAENWPNNGPSTVHEASKLKEGIHRCRLTRDQAALFGLVMVEGMMLQGHRREARAMLFQRIDEYTLETPDALVLCILTHYCHITGLDKHADDLMQKLLQA
jgi:hypothetical protein